MAVNTAALKTFAPAMRRQLMEAVGRKLDLLLNSQTPDTLSTYAKQIAELRDEQEKSREQLLERVAYTWFNRLCALRYLDAKGWHPFGCKVLMPADGSETQPELLKLMRSGSFPADLQAFTNEQRLNQLLDGQIPTAIPGGEAQGEVYRELVLAACRSYHHLLPDLFEGLDDASELLLPDDLLTEGSIAGSFRSAISDSDCDDVEIIGWLYQFYISEKKDEVIGKVVKSEDIPAATQLFTPNWIVKYMVQNTIGAQWLATYPDSPLREQMEFYIEPAEQTDEVKAKLAETTPTSLNPEELTLMDPACGSGHILVEAYEIFKAIYLEQGYQQREIAKLILEKNLFGIDIDDRAAQLTTFALLMKGRCDDRRLLERGPKTNVIALQENNDFDAEGLIRATNLSSHGVTLNDIRDLGNIFKYAKTHGSLLLIPDQVSHKLPVIKQLAEAAKKEMVASAELMKLKIFIRQAEMLVAKHDAVVANPPYMGSKFYNSELKHFVKTSYEKGKADLCSAFTLRNIRQTKSGGRVGMITIPSWMFLSSFEQFRRSIYQDAPISSLVHNGRGVWGSDFGSCAYVLRRSSPQELSGRFLRLFDQQGSVASNEELKIRFHVNKRFLIPNNEFKRIPGAPVSYWASDRLRNAFQSMPSLSELFEPVVGLQTSDNERFLRRWFEVDRCKSKLNNTEQNNNEDASQKWFAYQKGGDFRKWFGNYDFVVNWEHNGHEIKNFRGANGKLLSRPQNEGYYFREGLTWTAVSSSYFSVRYCPAGSIGSNAGMMVYGDSVQLKSLLSLMNSSLTSYIVSCISQTLNFDQGIISKIPLKFLPVDEIASHLITKSLTDWDAYERSWNFKSLPFLSSSLEKQRSLQSCYESWLARNKSDITEMQQLEQKNNCLLIEAYGLTEELDIDVPIEQITLTVNPAYRYGGDGTKKEKWDRFQSDSMSELLSYATGCMMGRYSLDHPGLILADSRSNQDEQLAAYEAKIGKSISEIQFKPDADAIIPVLDGEWFEDDIVARTREFLKVTFPESSVAENLRFIEDSIGKDIRKYFCKDFYKDHLQTYKKRPIYWMVQSPKAGFACLIYLHRYTPDTLLQVLNNYFRPYLQKLEARQEQLERDQNNEALPKREQTAARKEAEKITKVLKECQAWEQDALLPLAQQRIELDLDDGVKVNYLKLQEVLARIPGLAAKGD
ncbi:BREX-1 system adenine-specific DNA-methyltransferase PglX [Synechococcus sp. MU1648]|uniref:BREX-1 system adenine-specific DNA-methyltransferase PglX n=1 Tax=Synechococcus sp. MU1648 TaxID=2508351 RepID=UPI002025CAC8|nr:BREX-1 system adenine-specific DNA-methyltransferase PglX [Synechococcus sp. MU1648]